jgi:hypothetical protein
MAENQDSTETSRPNGEAPVDYVTLILDETGSMQDCKGAAIAGFNEYLATLRQIPTPVHLPSPYSTPVGSTCATVTSWLHRFPTLRKTRTGLRPRRPSTMPSVRP